MACLDVFPIGAKQAAQGNIVVPNLDGESFAQQMFDQLDLWTLSQIIGGSLKAQPENRDILLAGIEHQLNSSLQMLVVARQDGLEQRQLEIQFFGAIA